MNNKNLIITISSILLILSSCSQNTRNKIGLSTTGPDEYQVKRSAHLEVPPHYIVKPSQDKKKSKNPENDKNKISKSESALLRELNQDK